MKIMGLLCIRKNVMHNFIQNCIIDYTVMTIHDILLTQSHEQTQLLSRQFIEREEKIEGITSNLIHLIGGPRRSGKSSFGLW